MDTGGTKRKHSRKREAVLTLIRSVTSHPGAQWVYERLKPRIPELSLGTVYRNLRELREEGKAVSLGTVQGEERFDGRVEPHPHAVCSRCGRIADLSGGDWPALVSPPPAEISGFVIDIRHTVFYGLCDRCLQEIAVLDR